MTKVCMIAYTFYPRDPRVRREAEALASRGDSVDFICLKEQQGSAQRDYHGVHLHPLSVGRYQGDSPVVYLLMYASFFLKSFVLVSWLFLRKRYDLIQIHTMPDFLVFTALLPKLFGAKVILDVHDLMPELYMCKFKVGPKHPLIRLITWVEKRSIAFAHLAFAVHTPHRNALVSHGNPKEKFEVLLNVPDPRIFHKNGYVRNDAKFRLIYHGTVARRHGLEVALGAISLVLDKIPEVEFVVIGAGDNLAQIKKQAAEMGLNRCVRFLGTMPVEKLPEQLSRADVGLVPILYDPFTRYMLPLKLLEYVGMEIPCIVSETETIRAYFDDHMVRFSTPGSPEELARHILELYQQPQARRSLASNASSFNNSFNWAQQKQHYFNVVDSLRQKAAA